MSFNPAQWTIANFRYVVMEFPNTRQAIVNSIALAFGTGTLGAGIAAVLAWIVYRSQSAGRGVLEQLTMVPQAFPHVIFAVGFLWTVLILPIRIYNTLWAIQIAFLILFLPLAFRSMSGVIVQLSPSLEEAGRVLGASWLRMFTTITVPILAAGVASTWALLFMISVREVSASIFLAGPESPVLGPAIYSFWDSGGMPKVSALAMVQAVIVLAALFGVRAIVSRSNRTLA
jgi:iron(III) transport system permease protein